MALDPRIALEAKGPENQFGEGFKLGTDIRQTQAQTEQTKQQTANLAAAQPGIQAESDLKKKEADYEKWVGENQNNPDIYDEVEETGPDGAPVKSKVLNGFKLVGEAKKAGYFTQAQNAARFNLENIAKNVKNAEDQTKAVQLAAGYAGQLLEGIPEKQQAQVYAAYVKQLNSILPAQTPGGMGGGDMLGPYDPKKISMLKNMSMSPEAAQVLNNATQSTANQTAAEARAGQTGLSGPDAADPKSQVSKDIRKSLKDLGYNVPDNASAAVLNNSPIYQDIIKSGMKPAATRAAQEVTGISHEQNASLLEEGAKTARAITQTLKNATGLRIGDLIANKIDASIISNADQDVLRGLVQQAQEAGIPIRDDTSVSSIAKQLEVNAGILRKKAGANRTASESATFNKTEGGANANNANVEKVRVRAPDGSIRLIPRSVLKEALANGGKEVK